MEVKRHDSDQPFPYPWLTGVDSGYRRAEDPTGLVRRRELFWLVDPDVDSEPPDAPFVEDGRDPPVGSEGP